MQRSLHCRNNDFISQSMALESKNKGRNIPQRNDDNLLKESLRGVFGTSITSKPKLRVIVATILVALAFGFVICAMRNSPSGIDGSSEIISIEKRSDATDLFKCPAYRYTRGKWEWRDSLYRWTVASPNADEECKLELFSKERFCEVLNNRNILLVGDSVNKNLFQAFLHAYGATATEEQTIWSPVKPNVTADVHSSATICDRSTIAFIRNDYLTVDRMVSAHNHTRDAFLTPWIHLLKYNDVVILNSGAHTVEVERYASSLRKLKDFLVDNYNGTVLFRTTPRGHVGCKPNDMPIKEANDSDWKRFFTSLQPEEHSKYENFGYSLFPIYNEIMKEIAAPYTVIDIAPMFELRPDIHNAAEGDCLHIVNFYALEIWLQLVMNALLGNLE